jgi:hypothetical protein
MAEGTSGIVSSYRFVKKGRVARMSREADSGLAVSKRLVEMRNDSCGTILFNSA